MGESDATTTCDRLIFVFILMKRKNVVESAHIAAILGSMWC